MRYFFNNLLKDKLRIYQILSLLLFILSMLATGTALFFGYQSQRLKEYSPEEEMAMPTQDIPYYNQIMSLTEPLQYSGLQTLLRDDVNLYLDFTARKWQLKNIHRFDEQGNIMLEENRYGLCGELASFTYPKIKSLLGPNYDIEFMQVAESGFFLQPQSSHMALVIHEQKTDKTFLLDPSFHRYGLLQDFDDYLFYGTRKNLDFMIEKTKDIVLDVDNGTPVLIRNNRIAFLIIEAVDEKFNKDNFSIAIMATKRHHYAGRYVFMVRKKDGMIEVLENKIIAEKIFPPDVYKRLCQKILFWVSNYE
jgi:hypothetical protein